MARIIFESRLKKAIKDGTFIKNGKINSAESIKYDFTMGSKLLKSKFGQPIDINNLPEADKANLFVEFGEVVFVLTEEILDLPKNIKANLSPKRKLSHDGIMVLGGFCIDPLYNGRLLVGLYNFSSSPFPLRPGKKLIAAVFYELTDEEIEDFKTPEYTIMDFPDDLVIMMKKYHPISIQNLIEEFKNFCNKFDNLQKEFRDREDWFKKFQDSLKAHDESIEKILCGLDKEIEERRKAEKDMDKRITDIHAEILNYVKGAYKTAAIIGVVGALIISFIFFLIQKLL